MATVATAAAAAATRHDFRRRTNGRLTVICWIHGNIFLIEDNRSNNKAAIFFLNLSS